MAHAPAAPGARPGCPARSTGWSRRCGGLEPAGVPPRTSRITNVSIRRSCTRRFGCGSGGVQVAFTPGVPAAGRRRARSRTRGGPRRRPGPPTPPPGAGSSSAGSATTPTATSRRRCRPCRASRRSNRSGRPELSLRLQGAPMRRPIIAAKGRRPPTACRDPDENADARTDAQRQYHGWRSARW